MTALSEVASATGAAHAVAVTGSTVACGWLCALVVLSLGMVLLPPLSFVAGQCRGHLGAVLFRGW